MRDKTDAMTLSISRRTFVGGVAALPLAGAMSSGAGAQAAWPTRNVTMIVPSSSCPNAGNSAICPGVESSCAVAGVPLGVSGPAPIAENGVMSQSEPSSSYA